MTTRKNYSTIDSDGELFLEFVAHAKSELRAATNGDVGQDEAKARLRYMSFVLGAAEGLSLGGVGTLFSDFSPPITDAEFAKFEGALTRLTATIEVASARDKRLGMTTLRPRQRSGIQEQIDELRNVVERADIDEVRKRAIHRKLNEIEKELSRSRFDFQRSMAILATVVTLINQSEQALINMPKFIAAISAIVGADDSDGRRAAQLPSPDRQLALPDHSEPREEEGESPSLADQSET